MVIVQRRIARVPKDSRRTYIPMNGSSYTDGLASGLPESFLGKLLCAARGRRSYGVSSFNNEQWCCGRNTH